MLWFRSTAGLLIILTLILSLAMFGIVSTMCLNPSNGHAMNTDPLYNGTLTYYLIVILSQIFVMVAAGFGVHLSFRVWRNNFQMDHKLRHLFSMWLLSTALTCFMSFILGIMGLVRIREPQEEIMTLYEIFSKYNQDVSFVGSFERYQRQNSCCGINGPDDWMLAQFKQGGGSTNNMPSGGYDSYMGSPSTGKCHLTPPTIPMGCGKKVLEDIYWTKTWFAMLLVFETVTSVASGAFAWYCFFYWIEKEVIIIPEDEVSNLIVIEPESSTSSYTMVTDYSAMSGSRRSGSRNGSIYSQRSRSNYSQSQGGSFMPNVSRPGSQGTKVSNYATIPPMGGPHSAMLSMQMVDPNDEAEKINQNIIADGVKLHKGQKAKSIVYPGMGTKSLSGQNRRGDIAAYIDGPAAFSRASAAYSRFSGSQPSEETYLSRKSTRIKPRKLVKKEHSPNHMLHKQERALGGRVIAEMRIDHSRDPHGMISNMSMAHVRKGHKAHHATLAIVKNRRPPKQAELFSGPEKGHGQTGHLANDILAMSGGAGAAKSMIDDINLPVGHDPTLEEEGGYLKKLRKEKKKHGGHPDHDHPGRGNVGTENGVIEAPSADGSQAQDLLDALLAPPPPPVKKTSTEMLEVKPHDTVEKPKKEEKEKRKRNKKHHGHIQEHHHHAPSIMDGHGSIRTALHHGSIRTFRTHGTHHGHHEHEHGHHDHHELGHHDHHEHGHHEHGHHDHHEHGHHDHHEHGHHEHHEHGHHEHHEHGHHDHHEHGHHHTEHGHHHIEHGHHHPEHGHHHPEHGHHHTEHGHHHTEHGHHEHGHHNHHEYGHHENHSLHHGPYVPPHEYFSPLPYPYPYPPLVGAPTIPPSNPPPEAHTVLQVDNNPEDETEVLFVNSKPVE